MGIAAIDLVLKYAPLLLDRRAIEKVEGLLSENRRIGRAVPTYDSSVIEKANSALAANHKLWTHLAKTPEASETESFAATHFGLDQMQSTLTSWVAMGLVRKFQAGGVTTFVIQTRFDEVVAAKCPLCGNVHRATKLDFLVERNCTKCHTTKMYVLLG